MKKYEKKLMGKYVSKKKTSKKQYTDTTFGSHY